MPIPILAALALQAAGAGLSAYSANRANKKNREAMDAAARRVGQFQVNPLGNKLAQAYSESKLAENDLNQYQKQEAQDLLRAQGDVNYNLSNIAPSGFAALGAQSFNESKTQDQLGRLFFAVNLVGVKFFVVLPDLNNLFKSSLLAPANVPAIVVPNPMANCVI